MIPATFLFTSPLSDGTLKLVLKRGTVPFLGGLIGRLSLLCEILPRVVHFA